MSPVLSHELRAGGLPMLEVRRRASDAYARARAEKIPVAVFCLSIENLAHPALRALGAAGIWPILAERLAELPRGGELYAYLAKDRIVALLPSMPREAAELCAALFVESARKLALPSSDKPVRASVAVGLAFNESGADYFLETLENVAEEGLAVALMRGGECTAHSELYGLHQKKLERERPAASAAPVAAATPAPPPPSAPAARESTKLSAEQAARAKIERILAEEQSKHPHARTEPAEIETALDVDSVTADDLLQRLASTLSNKHRAEVEHLERRIAKLVRSLEETEVELAEMAQRKSIDNGVASAYRQVQGLGAGEKDRALKLELLAQIAHANLELRERLRQPS